jgi:WhiB family transcriptional regulator, redox-sensing transcriptional regulator
MVTEDQVEAQTASDTAGWRELALCVQVDPELWFPESGQPNGKAKLVCGWCDVQAECLAFPLRANEQYGVWGGLSPDERRRLRRRQREAATVAVEVEGEAA